MWGKLLLKTRWKLFNSTRKTGAMTGLLHTFHRVFNLWKNYRAFTECIDVFCGKLFALAKTAEVRRVARTAGKTFLQLPCPAGKMRFTEKILGVGQ